MTTLVCVRLAFGLKNSLFAFKIHVVEEPNMLRNQDYIIIAEGSSSESWLLHRHYVWEDLKGIGAHGVGGNSICCSLFFLSLLVSLGFPSLFLLIYPPPTPTQKGNFILTPSAVTPFETSRYIGESQNGCRGPRKKVNCRYWAHAWNLKCP